LPIYPAISEPLKYGAGLPDLKKTGVRYLGFEKAAQQLFERGV
jgi:hypothetical protein